MKKIYLIIFLFVIFLLSSCSNINDVGKSSFGGENENSQKEKNINSNKGIEISFSKDKENEINNFNFFEENNYKIFLDIDNYLLENSEIYFKIYGLSDSFVSGFGVVGPFEVQKASKFIFPYPLNFYELTDLSFSKLPKEGINFNLKVDYCYNSKTKYLAPLSVSRNSIVKQKESVDNGPLTISSLKYEKSSKNKFNLIFEIKNEAKGEIIESCNFEKEKNVFFDRENFKVKISGEELNCKSLRSNYFSNTLKKTNFVCEYIVDDLDLQNTFTTTLEIEMDYNYLGKTISKKASAKKSYFE